MPFAFTQEDFLVLSLNSVKAFRENSILFRFKTFNLISLTFRQVQLKNNLALCMKVNLLNTKCTVGLSSVSYT